MNRRAGATNAEFAIALMLLAMLGAALTGVFVTELRLRDPQTHGAASRGGSRSAMNLMMSELRMLEPGGGIVEATPMRLTVRAPYALAIVCGTTGVLTVSQLPVGPAVFANADYSGFAYRDPVAGRYTYVEDASTRPAPGGHTVCADANIAVVQDSGGRAGGRALQFPVAVRRAPVPGATVLLFQRITYEFRGSATVPGRLALWRRVDETAMEEEVVAPLDDSARFRFYVNDAAVAQDAAPAQLSAITGLELKLHGPIEGPDSGGERRPIRLSTSVFFKNRP